ncbi:MAG: hypothetical protein K1X94_04865 [Sandaracinaceae bacterium]|nr:hypothetical protein [Sandaracinaceae bacterium]
MRTTLFVSSIVGSLALAGCPSSNTGNLSRADFESQFTNAACDAIEACAGATVSDVFLSAAGGCEGAFGSAYRNGASPVYDMATARGTVTYNGAHARACLDALRASPCSLTGNGAAAIACQDVFVGTTAAGGACSINEECGVDQFCSITTACPGTCQARRTSGQDCSDDRHCAAGLSCRDSMCQAQPMVGAGCTELAGCSLGLLCSMGQCRPVDEVLVGTEGASCNLQTGPLCREGLSCVVDSVAPGGATFVCRGAVAAGAACRLGLPAQCPDGQYCSETNLMRLDFDGVCAPLPSTEGAACDLSGCAEGLRCTSNVCVRLRNNGEACETPSQCASGVCTSSVCVAPMLCGS